jgi:hypothetical protein
MDLETIFVPAGPPLFAVTRPLFFRPPFLPVPPPLMHSRFLLPMPGSHGILGQMLTNQYDNTRLGSPSAVNTSPNTQDESVLPFTTDGEYCQAVELICSSEYLAAEPQAKFASKKLKKSFQKKTKTPVLQETV